MPSTSKPTIDWESFRKKDLRKAAEQLIAEELLSGELELLGKQKKD